MPNIFTSPVGTHRAQSTAWTRRPANKKRKKQNIVEDSAEGEESGGDAQADVKVERSDNLEYTAVISPEERHQRSRAGQPLDQEPPLFPFPHAEDPSTKNRVVGQKRGPKTDQASGNLQSLRMQHLAALTSIVHLSLLKEDFSRASRALGLLFREDVVSENAAVRNQGFMGIAAEVLLRNGSSRDPNPHSALETLPFTHEGFEKAKRIYERLIIRHPYHKSWPNTTNAVDFYLAMFSMWIYVVHGENTTTVENVEDADNEFEADRKVRELEQANQIAHRLDTCMATVPYMDEPELIRLRANVALWAADLHEDCALIAESNENQVRHSSVSQKSASRSPEEEPTPRYSEHLHEAGLARDMAQEMLSKLEGRAPSDDE